ncbi:hypothetical protein V2G26_018831 [Clonostachys chloroleuca]|uniref:AA1-like domain-containing protein n=1 Tax=Clonostachys chloroleuca TaxID=1926264 RepID=A0AA35LWJ1_9HYPO|nr:unnamed protein product [Clonostachys chloroleuca]
MRAFTIAASAAFALFSVVAADTPKEDIWVSDFLVRKSSTETGTVINLVDFKITANDVTDQGCSAELPAFPNPTETVDCGYSKYRFSLHKGTGDNEFALRMYHDFALTGLYWGEGDVPVVCRAGGAGQGDYVCTQVTPVGIFVYSKPPPADA